MHNIGNLKEFLEKEVSKRNCLNEISPNKPDPLLVAKRYKDDFAILLCALFSYGNAKQIVKFLDSLDFSLLDKSEEIIKKELQNKYYRFQNSNDLVAVFIAFSRLRKKICLNDIFTKAYKKENNVLEGIDALIKTIYLISSYESKGYSFLLSSPFKRSANGKIKETGNSPYKRWNMFLRWMVRDDCIDLGLWKNISKSDLLLPLDVHTFKVSQKLGLLTRKTYDLKSAILISEKLKEFDSLDPIKYDFALYRIGQEKIL